MSAAVQWCILQVLRVMIAVPGFVLRFAAFTLMLFRNVLADIHNAWVHIEAVCRILLKVPNCASDGVEGFAVQ